jgi:hypothetical protein
MLMKKHLLLTFAAVTLFGASQLHATMPAGVFAGSWKVNFSKSKFPGTPPKVDECTVDPDGTVHVHEITSEGKENSWQYTPVAGQAVNVEGRDNTTVLVKNVNAHTNEQTWNFNGRSATSKAVVSKNGKTTTFTMDGTDKDGKPFHEMVVYDKQ